MNEKELETRLESRAQRTVARIVSELPEESVSMAWRSQLNERLLAIEQKGRRTFLSLIWKPALGLGLAGGLAALCMINFMPAKTPSDSFGASLISVHRQTVDFEDISGTGLSVHESEKPTASRPDGYDWQESDLDAL